MQTRTSSTTSAGSVTNFEVCVDAMSVMASSKQHHNIRQRYDVPSTSNQSTNAAKSWNACTLAPRSCEMAPLFREIRVSCVECPLQTVRFFELIGLPANEKPSTAFSRRGLVNKDEKRLWVAEVGRGPCRRGTTRHVMAFIKARSNLRSRSMGARYLIKSRTQARLSLGSMWHIIGIVHNVMVSYVA